jgi:ribonuclease HII
MKLYYNEDLLEAGIDEVARGCLAGPVYSAAVVWPKELDENENHVVLKDSKKLSKRQRLICKDYIEENAIDFSVASKDNTVIDEKNILNATFCAMHEAIDNLNIDVEFLLVDGTMFEPYTDNTNEIIPHKCFIKGDDLYAPISAASILAKVYHDQYIEKLLDDNEDLDVYGWSTNMCYGTKNHLDAIKEHGITQYHRKTFGICKQYA